MRKIPPEEAPHPKFRVKLHYLELYVPRLIVNPKIEIDVDKQLRPTNDGGSGKRLTYFYSRVETTTELLPGGITYWESGSLFQGGNDTTFIFKHHIWKYITQVLLPHHYPSFTSKVNRGQEDQWQSHLTNSSTLVSNQSKPSQNKIKQLLLNTGGLDPETGKPLLETLDFQINGQTPNRYMSSNQNTVGEGLLMKYYVDLFKSCDSYYANTGK